MTNLVKLKGGMNLPLQGVPEEVNLTTDAAVAGGDVYAMQPQDFPGIKPKAVVKEGQEVMAGDPLFCSKEDPATLITSPVSGVVTLIERGERRRLLSVKVKASDVQQHKDFGARSAEGMKKEEVKALLSESGLMAYIHQLPYDVVVQADGVEPKGIFVSCFNDKPLAASFAWQVKGEEQAWQEGITALSKVAPVFVGINKAEQGTALEQTRHAQVTVFDGKCPAGNVGVHVNHISPVGKGQKVWTVRPEVVLFIGRLLLTGKTDMSMLVAVGGSEVSRPAYRKALVGQSLKGLIELREGAGKVRVISGTPVSGVKTPADGYLSAAYSEVSVIPEGDDADEMLGWIMPRPQQLSKSRSYLSWLMPGRRFRVDARIKGGERHMIMSGEYDAVLPMDIYGEYLIKAILAQDIDKMEQLGIYEVAPEDFAVAEFVDSSKLPLQKIVRQGLELMRSEA